MKYIPILFSTPMVKAIIEVRKTMTRRKIKLYKADEHPLRQTSKWMKENKTCPYGKVGDILWVRETFCDMDCSINGFAYKADFKNDCSWKWKPSLFMPKAACRIFLEITDIRVERLQDISKEDAISEGIEKFDGENNWKGYFKGDYAYFKNPILSFTSLWRSINGFDSWDANPFVWVISFISIEKPNDF
jgi:hypothetical protein